MTAVIAIRVGAALLSGGPSTEPGVIRAAESTADAGARPAETTPPSTSAHEQASTEEWEALLPRLKQEVELHPEDAAARRRLAIAFYSLDRLDEAQAVYEDLLSEEEDPVVRNRLGNVLREKGDLVGAEAAYRSALTSDPALPAPYLNLAELLWRLRQTDEALDLLARGLSAVAPEARPALERASAAIRAGTGPATGAAGAGD